MKFERLHIPPARRRGTFLRPWARWVLGVALAIPALFYGIKGFFGMMPVAENILRSWGWL